MEQSKLISVFIAKLRVAYPNYFKDMSNEQILELVVLYQDMLSGYNEQTLNEALKQIIKTKRFMPSISEIIEVCDGVKTQVRNEIVEEMIKDGYFKSPRGVEKTYLWLEEGIIPGWLKKDMMKYYNKIIKMPKMIEGK